MERHAALSCSWYNRRCRERVPWFGPAVSAVVCFISSPSSPYSVRTRESGHNATAMLTFGWQLLNRPVPYEPCSQAANTHSCHWLTDCTSFDAEGAPAARARQRRCGTAQEERYKRYKQLAVLSPGHSVSSTTASVKPPWLSSNSLLLSPSCFRSRLHKVRLFRYADLPLMLALISSCRGEEQAGDMLQRCHC